MCTRKMVGLHSAIREQRRDRKSVSSEVAEPDSFLLDESFTDKFNPLSSLQDFEDLNFVDDWICEPDSFEMAETQTCSVKDEAAPKESSERKVLEECSPISLTIKTECSSPSGVDNVGVMIGDVSLDEDTDVLSKRTYEQRGTQNARSDVENGCPDDKTMEQTGKSGYGERKTEFPHVDICIFSENSVFEHSTAQDERRDVKIGRLDGISVGQTEKSGCEDGNIGCSNGSASLSEEDEISMKMLINVTSTGVPVAGRLLRPNEECVENVNSVTITWNNTEMSVLEKCEASFDSFRGFEHQVDNFVKSEESPTRKSHNVENEVNDLCEILSPCDTLMCEGNAGNASLIRGAGGDILENNVLKNRGVGLDKQRGFESSGANAHCPTGESEGTSMETSNTLTISGNGVSGLSVSGHDESHTNIFQGIEHNTKNEVKEFKNTKGSRIDYSDVESGEIVSEDEREECTGLMKLDCEDCEDCIDMVEPDREHSKDAVEPGVESCAGMVEPDSDYCSDSLLGSTDSDYSEEDDYVEGEDEGENKLGKGRRKPCAGSLDYDFGSSDEEVPKGPIRSKHELEVLPPVPPVNKVLESHHQTQPAGVIASVVGTSVVVEGNVCHTPLNEGTILWNAEKRLPLGFVDEVFGPVKSPFYLVRFNAINDVPDFAKEGVFVSYVPQFASYVLKDPNLYKKGYDASGDNDEELSEEVDFSDDEKEAGYKREKKCAKRGAKSTQNVHEMSCGRARRKPEFVDYRKNRFGHSRFQQNANNVNGVKGRAQEMKFSSKKPFEDGYNNGSQMSTNQAKDFSRPGVTSFQHMPQSAQYRGGLQNSGNHSQKSSRHLSHQGGFVKQMAIRSADPGNSSHGLHLFNGAPSFNGRVAGGIHPLQPSFVARNSLCDGDYKANSSTNEQNSLHNQAQISHLGQLYAKPTHDPLGQSSQVQHHTGTSHDPVEQISPGQLQFRPICGPPQGFHPTNLGQRPGGPLPIGQQTNVNHMGFPPMPVHPTFLGHSVQSSSIQQAMAFMAWNAGQSGHGARGSQFLPSNANQGTGNPLNFNQMQTCVGLPVLQQPGLYTNMGALPAHNLMPCPMPWGQQPIPQGSTSHLPPQNQSIPFQEAKDSPLQHD